jgi:hypothetical protein
MMRFPGRLHTPAAAAAAVVVVVVVSTDTDKFFFLTRIINIIRYSLLFFFTLFDSPL